MGTGWGWGKSMVTSGEMRKHSYGWGYSGNNLLSRVSVKSRILFYSFCLSAQWRYCVKTNDILSHFFRYSGRGIILVFSFF